MPKKAATKSTKPVIPPAMTGLDPAEPKLSKALFARLHYLHHERKRLQAEARQLETEEHLLRDVAFAWLEDNGLKSIVKFGFRCAQKLGRVVVPWREAYVRECGSEAAAKLTAESPKSISLEIELE